KWRACGCSLRFWLPTQAGYGGFGWCSALSWHFSHSSQNKTQAPSASCSALSYSSITHSLQEAIVDFLCLRLRLSRLLPLPSFHFFRMNFHTGLISGRSLIARAFLSRCCLRCFLVIRPGKRFTSPSLRLR